VGFVVDKVALGQILLSFGLYLSVSFHRYYIFTHISRAVVLKCGHGGRIENVECLLPFGSESFVIPPAVQECKG
jgi:hypothetical protein